MTGQLSAALDRRLQDLIVAWGRRRWPALRLVPGRWLRPSVATAALRLRRLLAHTILAAMAAGIIVGLLVA